MSCRKMIDISDLSLVFSGQRINVDFTVFRSHCVEIELRR
jgi:hypothetical protein